MHSLSQPPERVQYVSTVAWKIIAGNVRHLMCDNYRSNRKECFRCGINHGHDSLAIYKTVSRILPRCRSSHDRRSLLSFVERTVLPWSVRINDWFHVSCNSVAQKGISDAAWLEKSSLKVIFAAFFSSLQSFFFEFFCWAAYDRKPTVRNIAAAPSTSMKISAMNM